MTKKVIAIIGSIMDASLFSEDMYDDYECEEFHWHNKDTPDILNKRDDIAAILFTGGSDVHPMLYNQKNTQSAPNLKRDLVERDVFAYGIRNKIPMLGVCRGAQLMNVLTGGSMIQHIDKHSGYRHDIITMDNKIIPVNSIHHQAMVPGDNMKVLAKSADGVVEAIIDEEHKLFGVQYHPEMMNVGHPGRNYFHSIVKQYELL